MKILVTGAAGFIGSEFAREALRRKHEVLVYDLLTYAGSEANLAQIRICGDFEFVRGDIRDGEMVDGAIEKFCPDAIVHFAAESHVDNSISGPKSFVETNIVGTFQLLESARKYFEKKFLSAKFRFLHVSTDEVFGELGEQGFFNEDSAYKPNSPYSASKAASDHLVRAWFKTFGLPVVTTNCSNNYGPRQHPEKLIPNTILNALAEMPIPIYGKGQNIRDWIHVEDHCRGIFLALEKGALGETYCFGGQNELTNLAVAQSICNILDQLKPRPNGKSYFDLIHFVEDRKGHDFRYAIESVKADALGFRRNYKSLKQGLEQTVAWYLENSSWTNEVRK